MPIKSFLCEKCLTNYNTEKDAVDCERSHRDHVNFRIDSVRYKDLTNIKIDSATFHISKNIPETVRIRFSEDDNDFAIYKLLDINL